MTKLNRWLFILNVLLVMFFVACGGGSGGSSNSNNGNGGGPPAPTPTATIHGGWSASPVFSFFKASTTAKAQPSFWDKIHIVEQAYAATTVIPNLTGSYSGFCNQTPTSRFNLGSDTEFVIYGIGRWDTQDCGNNWSSVSNDGAPVIGNGTLSGLIVQANVQAANHADSGLVKIYKNPGNVFTGITCALGSGTPLSDGQIRCTDLTTAPAIADGENVYATMTEHPDDQITNVRLVLGKQ